MYPSFGGTCISQPMRVSPSATCLDGSDLDFLAWFVGTEIEGYRDGPYNVSGARHIISLFAYN